MDTIQTHLEKKCKSTLGVKPELSFYLSKIQILTTSLISDKIFLEEITCRINGIKDTIL